MGSNAGILSYGKFKVYDSLAPEFETYETIKELAQSKLRGLYEKSIEISGVRLLLKKDVFEYERIPFPEEFPGGSKLMS